MSERIEIKDDGYSVVIKPKGKGQARLFVNDTDSITQKTIAAIRQQQAEIEKLRAELAEITQEVSQSGYLGGPSLSACVNAMAGRLKNLQSELAAIRTSRTCRKSCATTEATSGMSLRDHFAGLAMQGIVSSIHSEEDYQRIWKLAQYGGLKVSEWIARDSYKQADAMLRARGE